MKTLELKLKKRILLVELPKGISVEQALAEYKATGNEEWEFVCKAKDLTEEITSKIVESWKSVSGDGTDVFENYNNTIPKCKTALESFKSAVDAKGFWLENPCVDEPSNDMGCECAECEEDFEYDYKKWQEAQSRTFSPECLIFEIL